MKTLQQISKIFRQKRTIQVVINEPWCKENWWKKELNEINMYELDDDEDPREFNWMKQQISSRTRSKTSEKNNTVNRVTSEDTILGME